MRSLSALPTPLLLLLSAFNAAPILADEGPTVKIETTTPASCSRPSKSGDKIAVHYKGSLQSTGVEFDQSYKRGQPIVFRLGVGQVIKGWDDGLQDMCPGEARILTIPPELGYGPYGSPPVIPGGATLIFETELVDIVGVKQESLTFATTSTAVIATDEGFTIATAPPTPVDDDEAAVDDSDPTIDWTSVSSDDVNAAEEEQAECRLLGPFALIVQGALGAVALLSLVYKRWRETPKRPWKIWFFDVSKQVFGSMLTHVINLVMSMFATVDVVNAAKSAATMSDENGRKPNPCSFYTLNIGIDTTIGIGVLWVMLKILHGLFSYTPLAKPPESIKSGHYGQPPKVTWYLKQILIYFLGLSGMKLFVFFLFAALPWLPWVGDWALRWTEGNEALQIAFALFLFPLIMNAIQYWIIDSLIMEKSRGKQDGGGSYQQVQEDDDGEYHEGDDDETITQVEEDGHGKGSGGSSPPLKEVNPTPIPNYNDNEEGSRREETDGIK